MSFYKQLLCLAALAVVPMATSLPAYAYSVDSRAVVRTNDGIAVTSAGNCVRTRWDAGTDICAPPIVAASVEPAAVSAMVLSREDRTIYFDFNKATITPAARAKLDNLEQTLSSDKNVKQARIVGYADRIGSRSANAKLSERRSKTVRDYIVNKGFVRVELAETRWLGKDAPTTNCSKKLSRQKLISCLQPDRRVELEIDYLKPQIVAVR